MVDATMFRTVLGHYPTGVCVITTVTTDGRPIGMSIGSFTSASLDPPLVAFFPDRRSSTWRAVGATGRFCVNVLGKDQEMISRRFAATGADRFDGLAHRPSGLGLPILDGIVAWIDCHLHAVHEAGDHFLVLGAVASLAAERPTQPLLFHRGRYGHVHALAAAA